MSDETRRDESTGDDAERVPFLDLLEKTHFGRYLLATRRPVYSLLFLLPLLVVYEIFALVINFNSSLQIRNGADIIVRYVLRLFGIRSLFGFMMTVVLAVVVMAILAYQRHKDRIEPRLFLYMLAESAVYGLCIGTVSARLTSMVLLAKPALLAGGVPGDDAATRLMIALGAGVYEEIVFRVVLIWAFLALFGRILGMSKMRSVAASVLLAALVFSGFHYVGEYADVFTWSSFVFRFMAGLVLSLLYVARGLGITAWSHSLYDVFLMFGWV